MNQIHVNDSQIGFISTGTIARIGRMNIHLNEVRQQSSDIAEALRAFTQAVVNSSELPAESKTETLDLVEGLTVAVSQTSGVVPKKHLFRPWVTRIAELVNVSASLTTLWGAVTPHLAHLLS